MQVVREEGQESAITLLDRLRAHAQSLGIALPFTANTPYLNTISPEKQAIFPGDQEIERRIKSLVRWNALAMVVRANRVDHSIGGHISTYASAATLFEVGFNHFFRGRTDEFEGDTVYLQGHASPGVYARAFLEGRLSVKQLENFRRELREGGGLSSYPHPWLMPDFWEFPTVSMGLSPLMAIYQARFNRYLEDRSLKPRTDAKVWAFLGDGETDEPETLGAITLASRENLDNLIFVINCNLQRLDGPVRGNGKIVQELEAAFRGAGWNCIKVLWGSDWDPLFERDTEGLLAKRLGEMVDGETQKISVESGAYVRQHVFGGDPRLLENGRGSSGRGAANDAPGRPRSAQSVCRLQSGVRTQGISHRHSRAHDQGLRPRRKRRGTQHHAPAEKAQRRGASRVSLALRHSDQRRAACGNAVLSSAGRQPRNPVPARAQAGAGRLRSDAQGAVQAARCGPRRAVPRIS